MKDKYLAVKISFPESDFAGATIYLEAWQAERLKARDVYKRQQEGRTGGPEGSGGWNPENRIPGNWGN